MILIIMSLMAGVALPRYGRSMARYRVYVAARRVAADLTLARERARITSASQQVVFDSTLNRYQLPGVADTRLSTDTYTVRLADNPYHAKLSSPVFGSDAIVVFDGYGRPDSGGSVVVLVGSESKTITLAAESGEVAIQ